MEKSRKIINGIVGKRHQIMPPKIMKNYYFKKEELVYKYTWHDEPKDILFYYYENDPHEEKRKFMFVTMSQYLAEIRNININEVLDIQENIDEKKMCDASSYDKFASVQTGDIIKYRSKYVRINKKTPKRLEIKTPETGWRKCYISEREFVFIDLISKEEGEIALTLDSKEWYFGLKF